MLVEQDEQKFALNLITALTQNLDDPTPEHKEAANALLAELDQRIKQLPPVDMDAYAAVCDRLEVFENLPDSFVTPIVQEAITYGNIYLDTPTEENLSNFEAVSSPITTQIDFDLDTYGEVLAWFDLLKERQNVSSVGLWAGAYEFCERYLAAPTEANYELMYSAYRRLTSSWSYAATTSDSSDYDPTIVPQLPEPKPRPEISDTKPALSPFLSHVFHSFAALLGIHAFHQQAEKEKEKD